MPDTPPPAQVFLRPIGSPLTIGMSGLAIASLVQAGFELGWIAKVEALEVGLVMIAVPFVLQLVAAVMSYLARDGATGAALGQLAGTWFGFGLIYIVGHGRPSNALGLLFVASGSLLLLTASAVSAGKLLPAIVFALAGSKFVLSGVYQLSGGSSWQQAAGIVGLVVFSLGAYAMLAFELEGALHRAVLPTVRYGRALTAFQGPFEEQIQDVANEPGVRTMT